jgi:hypothetical protein
MKAVCAAIAPRQSHEEYRLHSILAEFEGLDGPARDRAGRDLLQLWDAFSERFDGLEGYLAAHALEKNAYIAHLKGATERIAPQRLSAAGHYHHTAMLMLAYITALSHQVPSQMVLVLAARAGEAMDRARTLSRERSAVQQNAANSPQRTWQWGTDPPEEPAA